ncbi:ABC transporter ATP-binding protein [Ottowia thiooxydans]|uniref:ABC transporter ATP-binding protein n=1 Tax=Ottowia thiooxydans TaxID=219182 RepID=UPI0003FECD81|nr:ABC transporter ATP-binding protein [Ottowia thiooxydans]
MPEPLLSVADLRVSFRVQGAWREVVHGVSFDLHAGETLAIVGESGSGKSVTALAIMRLLSTDHARTEGRITLAGQELTSLPERSMQAIRGNQISMVFQEPMTSLNPVLSVGYQIGEALRQHRGLTGRAARDEAVRLLDRVHVPNARGRVKDYPQQFSGGMRQRVMIAMALACEPDILIADEPTTALDVTIQAQILDLIKELQADTGMAALFITHDMGVVAEIADRTLVMYQGHAVEAGSTAAIFETPHHAYTRALLAAVPRLGDLKGKPRPEPFSLVDTATGHTHKPSFEASLPQDDVPPVLAVHGLTTRFDVRDGLFGRVTARVHAVENVSFTIQPGETLALVGESGSGKSTIGRSIIGLVTPTSGSIELDGQEISGFSRTALASLRKRMQILFQDPYASLDPRQTIGQAIAEPLLFHGLADRSSVADQVATALRKVSLDPDMASRYPHEFSGGQRQRVCLARILGLQPSLIIADESVSALDVSVKARIINLMLQLQAELGLAYLFISHDLATVERISHRIAVMYLGEIVEIGMRDAILNNPQHPYTRQLLSAVPVPDPGHRRQRAAATSGTGIDSRSQRHPLSYVSPSRTYRNVSPSHLVLATA